jgi:hypothetical protein
MLNPIKRTWVPKKVETPPAVAPAATPNSTQATPKAPPARNASFNEVPEMDVEEKNSDSVWAEFETVYPPEVQHK